VAKGSRFTAVGILLAVTAGALAVLLYLFRDREALFRNGLAAARMPHASIEVIAFDQHGRRLNSLDFFRTWRPTLIVRDHSGAVCMGIQYGMTAPRLAVPAAEPVTLELLWPVSGFGKVLLSADNAGRGYRVSAGAYTRIELMPELARSRIVELEQWVAHHNQSHPIPDEVVQQLAFARRQLARVDAIRDPRERASLAMPALRAALQGSEQAVLADDSSAIAERRSGNLLVKVIDPHGTEVPQVKIQIAQMRPEFLFGIATGKRGYPPEVVARLKQLGLNYAPLDLKWAELEPRAGVYAFDSFDRRFNPAGLKHDGFVLRARGLTASETSPLPNIAAMRGNLRALVVAIPAQLVPIVDHYKDLVDVWQIEQDASAWAGLGLSDAGITEVIKAVIAEIRKQAPDARIMINVVAPFGQDVAAQYNRKLLGLPDTFGKGARDPYFALQHLTSAGVTYDLIGLEFCCGGFSGREDWSIQPPAIDLFRFARELERWSSFAKPLQIGGLAAGSGVSVNSWWHASPDEGTQADYMADAAIIAYADPKVQAITWPALFDSEARIPGGGLIDRAKRPKAAYDRLSALLSGWRSTGNVTTGSDGLASFQGTPGDYRLTAQVTPEPIEGTARIHQNASDVAIMSTTTIVPLPMPSPLPPNGMENPGDQGMAQSPGTPEPFILEPPPPMQQPPYQPPGP